MTLPSTLSSHLFAAQEYLNARENMKLRIHHDSREAMVGLAVGLISAGQCDDDAILKEAELLGDLFGYELMRSVLADFCGDDSKHHYWRRDDAGRYHIHA